MIMNVKLQRVAAVFIIGLITTILAGCWRSRWMRAIGLALCLCAIIAFAAIVGTALKHGVAPHLITKEQMSRPRPNDSPERETVNDG